MDNYYLQFCYYEEKINQADPPFSHDEQGYFRVQIYSHYFKDNYYDESEKSFLNISENIDNEE